MLLFCEVLRGLDEDVAPIRVQNPAFTFRWCFDWLTDNTLSVGSALDTTERLDNISYFKLFTTSILIKFLAIFKGQNQFIWNYND